ncbi:hypothetical protein [Cyanothece sp. BG0011]|uniref:hypothetical protein n=1 Tax=Cyanothece sp. BG0011 TaxID=2082950 RepID=UPI000D1E1DA9|nr:hypothetical protein [Cyanothece sp. BG0011]
MLNTTNNTIIIRNYIILTATVMFTAMGLTDTFSAPTRIGQQDRINNFGQVLSAGLVSYSQTLGR